MAKRHKGEKDEFIGTNVSEWHFYSYSGREVPPVIQLHCSYLIVCEYYVCIASRVSLICPHNVLQCVVWPDRLYSTTVCRVVAP